MKLVKAYDEAIKKSYIDNNKQVESYLMDNGIYFNDGYKTLLGHRMGILGCSTVEMKMSLDC